MTDGTSQVPGTSWRVIVVHSDDGFDPADRLVAQDDTTTLGEVRVS